MGKLAVEVKNLIKYYGSIAALKGVTFEFEEGVIYGLIGPNGAGKTTALRIIATLLKPSGGYVKVFGYEVGKDDAKIRRIVGYLPEEAGGYRYLTGLEYLEMSAKIYDPKNSAEAVELGIKISGLGDRLYDKIGSYSKGMIRRLLLARSLMNKPKLAILDEPTTGMDVIHATYIRNLIKNIVKEGITVLLSSHNMLEVQFLCNELSLISNGLIVASGTPREILDKTASENLEEAFVKIVRGETRWAS